MPLIRLIGKVSNAEGAVIQLSVGGPNHFFFNKSYDGSFNERLNLDAKRYKIFLSVFTDGNFKFDVKGEYQSISPEIPDNFTDKNKEVYTLTI